MRDAKTFFLLIAAVVSALISAVSPARIATAQAPGKRKIFRLVSGK